MVHVGSSSKKKREERNSPMSLHDLLSTELSVDLSLCLGEFRIHLLWLLIICLVLFMQLSLILMVLRLKIFLSLFSSGKCLSTRVRNL